MSKKKKNITMGTFNKHIRGFGFVKIENSQSDEEIYIGKSNTKGAMNGDLVSVELLPGYLWEERPEGIITNIIERSTKTLVGTLQAHKGFGFVVPEEKNIKDDIFIKKSNLGNAKNGDKVVVEITHYPTKKDKAEGVITEIISKAGDKDAIVKALIRSRGLKEQFPVEVIEEIENTDFKILDEDIKGRLDLRGKRIITIDGPYSKDLDDAVSLERTEKGTYLLGVHIADVSHYVKENSPLDKEALNRGNSVYLLDKVIPMLPKELSNGICSLNQDEDRLTLTCEMEIDKDGNVINHKIFPSVIKSMARMVYDDVSDILENKDADLINKYENIYDDLLLMEELTHILRKKKKETGGLDFELPEAKIVLDDNNNPINVEIEERRIANIIIEEFMLAANRTVAEHFYWLNAPFVYRVHENPDRDKMQELKSFLAMFGIGLKGKMESVHPNTLSNIMEQIKGEACESIINTVILRSMKKAFYSPECLGHFGLAYKYYCHFTSPIRRYPDLIIHRIIKQSLKGQLTDKECERLQPIVLNAAKISSDQERKAAELERDVEKMKKAEYILNFVGRKFQGVISGVTQYGVYVELENTIEGMARLDSFKDDFYIFDPKRYRVIGENTKNVYALGQKVIIKVKGANPEARQIDFSIVRKI